MENEINSITTLTELLNWRAQENPDKVAFHFHQNLNDYEAITYRELQQRAQNLARKILKSAKPGERILIVLEPGINFIVAFFAALYAGVVAVPIYPPADKTLTKKMQHVINDCQPQVLLTTEKVGRQLKISKWLNYFPHVSFFIKKRFSIRYPQLNIETLNMNIVACEKGLNNLSGDLPIIEADKLAFLQYSSGSTGEPKGIMLTHRNLIENLRLIFKDLDVDKDTIGLVWLPPYHDMGLIGGILQPIYAGFFTALFSPLSFIKNPKLWLQLITHYKATITGGPNFCFAYIERILRNTDLTQINLSSLRIMFNGAEPVKAATMDLFAKKFSMYGFRYEMFFPCYGLAEATLYVTSHHANEKNSLIVVDKDAYAQGAIKVLPATLINEINALVIVAAGKVQNGVAIYDANTHTFANEGTLGEIIVHNPCISQGYWGKPELSKEIFCAKQSDGKYYLKTGDLGFIHNDILYISGRSKDVIIVRGKNYYPHDLEEVAQLTLTFIRPGGCVAMEDPATPEHILFIAEVSEGQVVGGEQFTQLAKRLSSAYGLHLSMLVLVPRKSLPKTTSGKLRRFLCKNMYLNNEFVILNELNRYSEKQTQSAESEVLLDSIMTDPLYLWLLNWLRTHMDENLTKIDMKKSLNDYLVDSTLQIKFVTDVAAAFFAGSPDVNINFEKNIFAFYLFIKDMQAKKSNKTNLEKVGHLLFLALYVPIHFIAKIICRGLGAILSRTYIRVESSGFENLNLQQQYIFVANHNSHMDSLVLFNNLKQEVIFLAARDYFFVNPLKRFFATAFLPLLPIARQELNVVDFINAEKALKNQRSLVIYPEGTRSTSGTLQKFKLGAALLSIQTQTPVVPIYIEGTYRLFPKNQFWPKSGKVKMLIGKPINPPAEGEIGKDTLVNLTSQYEDAVRELGTQACK